MAAMAAAIDTLDREVRNKRSEAARKDRLVADPIVGVSDLIKPLQISCQLQRQQGPVEPARPSRGRSINIFVDYNAQAGMGGQNGRLIV